MGQMGRVSCESNQISSQGQVVIIPMRGEVKEDIRPTVYVLSDGGRLNEKGISSRCETTLKGGGKRKSKKAGRVGNKHTVKSPK